MQLSSGWPPSACHGPHGHLRGICGEIAGKLRGNCDCESGLAATRLGGARVAASRVEGSGQQVRITGGLRWQLDCQCLELAAGGDRTRVRGALGNDNQVTGADLALFGAQPECAFARNDVLDLVGAVVEVLGNGARAASSLRLLFLVTACGAQVHVAVVTMDVQFGVLSPGYVPTGCDCRFHRWKFLGLDIEAAELQCPTTFCG